MQSLTYVLSGLLLKVCQFLSHNKMLKMIISRFAKKYSLLGNKPQSTSILMLLTCFIKVTPYLGGSNDQQQSINFVQYSTKCCTSSVSLPHSHICLPESCFTLVTMNNAKFRCPMRKIQHMNCKHNLASLYHSFYM